MEKPWLIYRCVFKEGMDSSGIDSLLRYDYMGSSEYEFGALPKSLNRFIEKIDKTGVFETLHKRFDDKGLFLLCGDNEKDEYCLYIDEMVNEKYESLKERIYLNKNLCDKNIRYGKAEIFWDIENDIIFGFGKDNIKKVKEAIENVKRKREGK